MTQINNKVFCSNFLFSLDIKTKLIPNQYYDYPYLIIDDFLTKEECTYINKSIKKDEDFEKAKVRAFRNLSKRKLNENIRKTRIYELEDRFLDLYNNKFKNIQGQIEEYFNLALTTATSLQVLEYLSGSFYSMHSDDSSMLFEEEKIVGFLPVTKTRILTTVLFTTSYEDKINNDETFNGGELLFNFLLNDKKEPIKIKPKAGQIVIFPSNPIFCHEVLKVKEGRRISLVQWHNAIIN